MILGLIASIVLLVVVVPVVVVLLRGVLDAARRVSAAVDEVERAAKTASADLDAVELLATTQTQVNQTIGVVANYGGSLDVILEDA
jgi:Tfp pilus assembly protein PilX